MLATRVHAAGTKLTTMLVLHETNWQEWTDGNADRQCKTDAQIIYDYLMEWLPADTVRHLGDIFEANKPTPEVQDTLDQMFGDQS